jgi:hypothetical protein
MEDMFSVRSVPDYITRVSCHHVIEPSAWGYNRATLFLEDMTRPSRLGDSRTWDSKMWSWGENFLTMADCLENVKASISHNPTGLHSLFTGLALPFQVSDYQLLKKALIHGVRYTDNYFQTLKVTRRPVRDMSLLTVRHSSNIVIACSNPNRDIYVWTGFPALYSPV